MATITKPSDFVILGPVLARGNKVLEAVHALYFLPENFKLVFTGDTLADQSFYDEVVSLVERDELDGRVRFAGKAPRSQAVIVPKANGTGAPGNVSGDSPEALASAILNVARATA